MSTWSRILAVTCWRWQYKCFITKNKNQDLTQCRRYCKNKNIVMFKILAVAISVLPKERKKIIKILRPISFNWIQVFFSNLQICTYLHIILYFCLMFKSLPSISLLIREARHLKLIFYRPCILYINIVIQVCHFLFFRRIIYLSLWLEEIIRSSWGKKCRQTWQFPSSPSTIRNILARTSFDFERLFTCRMKRLFNLKFNGLTPDRCYSLLRLVFPGF